MTFFISVPCKGTVEVQWAKALQSFWRDFGSTQVAQDAEKLEAVRKDVMTPEPHQNSLFRVVQYYVLLLSLASKLPDDETGPSISFGWYPAFSKSIPLAQATIKYEMACVLFNIAALWSQIAASENTHDAEGVKRASSAFQRAAGIFSQLSTMEGFTRSDDLSENVCRGLECLMLAQAQECFFMTAVQEKMKKKTLAKLAQGSVANYSEALTLLSPTLTETSTSIFKAKSNGFLTNITVKTAAMKSQAFCMRAREHQEQSEFGPGVARLKQANEAVKNAISVGGPKVDPVFQRTLKALESQLSRELQAAENDNDRAYMDIVPNEDKLTPIPEMMLVKKQEFNPFDDTLYPADDPKLFSWILPKEQKTAVDELNNERTEFANAQVRKVNDAIRDARAKLQSLGLPGRVEAVSKPDGLPSEVLNKSKLFRNDGGLKGLDTTLQTLSSFRLRFKQELAQLKEALDNELRADQEGRTHFQGDWDLRPSSEMQANLRRQQDQYVSTIEQASLSDEHLRSRIDQSRVELSFLELTEDELARNIPSLQGPDMSSSPTVKKLQDLLAQLESRITDIEKGVQDLRSRILKQDIVALAGQTKGNFIPTAFKSNAMSTYRNWAEQLNQSDMDILLAEIRVSSSALTQEQQSQSRALEQRSNAISRLNKAYNTFADMAKRLQEGLHFYSGYERSFDVHQKQVRDFCESRRIQTKIRMEELSTRLAGFSIGSDGSQPPDLPPR